MSSYQSKVNQKSTFRPSAPRLMDQVREVLRYHHYGFKTEKAYVYWIKDFIFYHQKRHPKEEKGSGLVSRILVAKSS